MYKEINSGCKSFDELAKRDLITTGNVWGLTQLSGFVRGKLETECNGYSNFEPGHLQDYDLKLFDHVPKNVLSELKKAASGKESVIFYEFRTFKQPNQRKQKFVHTYVICSTNNELKRVFVNARGRKSSLVAEAVLPRISVDTNGKISVNFF